MVNAAVTSLLVQLLTICTAVELSLTTRDYRHSRMQRNTHFLQPSIDIHVSLWWLELATYVQSGAMEHAQNAVLRKSGEQVSQGEVAVLNTTDVVLSR